ncbi:MAG TPA: hypothetical protein EYP54_08575 [Anaerolineales bacterium]|nr:hypothetical protein [Anaerolineales bacterium]
MSPPSCANSVTLGETMPLLDEKRLHLINRRVYRDFPEFRGARPIVRRLRTAREGQPPRVLLLYRRRVTTADGKRLTRMVRVLATPKGKILKITTSK